MLNQFTEKKLRGPAGQLLALAHVKVSNGSVIAQVNYGYNSVGNRTNRVESFTGFSAATDAYTYDPTDQLTAVSYNGGARTTAFDYDKMGNLTNRQDTSTGTNTFTANNLNQLSTLNSQTLNYDGSGNLTNRPGWLYVWNANNQLMVAEPSSPTNGAVKMTFAYDGKHRCVRRQTWAWSTNTLNYQLSNSQHLLYSGWSLIEERDSGTNIVTYAYGPRVDEILAKFTSTNTVFYHGDAQNSTLALTDASANVLERYRYEAFGLPSIFSSTFSPLASSLYSVRHLFQGREWLAEVKLTDHRFRYYSPELQRWLSRDPIGEFGGLNVHIFSGNSATMVTDPDGLKIKYEGPDASFWKNQIDFWKSTLPKDSLLLNIILGLKNSPNELIIQPLDGTKPETVSYFEKWVKTYIDPHSYLVDGVYYNTEQAFAHELLHAHDHMVNTKCRGRHHGEGFRDDEKRIFEEIRKKK